MAERCIAFRLGLKSPPMSREMSRESYSDDLLRGVLQRAKTIAVVGASPDPYRDSHQIMGFLQAQGYRAIPVNPTAAGTRILGEQVYASLPDIPLRVDLVDV